MYYLKTGDLNNSKQINQMKENPENAETFLELIYDHTIDVNKITDSIFSLDTFSEKDYNNIVYALTLGDMLPADSQIDVMRANALFFCLQVNVFNILHNQNKRIPDPYLAIKTAQTFNWDYAQYMNSEETVENNLEKEKVWVEMQFPHLMTKFRLQLPIVYVKKGIFKKRISGYMLDTDLNAYGILHIPSSGDRCKIYKTYILDLIKDNLHKNKSMRFTTSAELVEAIDRENGVSVMLNVLNINGYYGLGAVNYSHSSDAYIDEDHLLYISTNRPGEKPEIPEEYSSYITMEQLQDFLFRIRLRNHKPYIAYFDRRKIYLLAAA